MTRRNILTLALLSSCSRQDDTALIDKQLELFEKYMREMNHFGVASLFTEDGVLAPDVRGPRAIQQYLATTAGLKVVEYSIDASKPAINANLAKQTVVYQKTVRTPQGNTAQISGRLVIDWIRTESGRWLIQKLVIS
jgi:ketosteroid isomerase-like protein